MQSFLRSEVWAMAPKSSKNRPAAGFPNEVEFKQSVEIGDHCLQNDHLISEVVCIKDALKCPRTADGQAG